jgi:predicted nucleotidyltransferase
VQQEDINYKNQTVHKIRIGNYKIKSIKTIARDVFGSTSDVWLFGSRVNYSLKGGDIDIYIETDNVNDLFRKKVDFLVKLKDKIGEQKIDVIVKQKGCKEFICLEAKKTGVKF